jgi:hypothetical protein
VVTLATGRPLVASVIRTSDLYPGPRRAALPDLLLEWDKSGPIERVTSPKIGELACRDRGVRSGDHVHKRGVFFALGPGVVAARAPRPVSAVDFAPTFASLLGLSRQGYAGSPIPGIVPDDAGAGGESAASGRDLRSGGARRA